ncbi:MAG: adenosine deaminase [Xanthobacteraceae bacterium]
MQFDQIRRRIVLAVILLAAAIAVVRLVLVARDFDTVITAANFEAARDDRTALRAFLQRMPKGGDLHTHLVGAVYAERFIAWAAQQGLCVDPSNVLLAKSECGRSPGAVPVAQALGDQTLYDRLVNAFSMRGFLPSPAVPTEHDEFFATFDRFDAVTGAHFVDMMVDRLRQYDSENVQYVEFMVLFFCPSDRDRFLQAIADKPDDTGKLAALQASGLNACVKAKRDEISDVTAKIRMALGCRPPETQAGCRVTFRYIQQVLRDTPVDDVFIQTAVAAALIRAEPQMMVALNFVQPEDSLVARRDYTRHMEIIRFLAKDVPVALHAGELWLGLVPPQDLTFHIREAIEIAGARRIGHGVALAFERDMDGLLAEMRRRSVAVEISLTSNDVILGVRGKDHPLPAYLAAGVPVVLSTDDSGVSRINLTNEYFRAVRDYGLGYRALKGIARSALIHSFLDDGQKRQELARFDRSYAEFERSTANGRAHLQNALTLIKAAIMPPA